MGVLPTQGDEKCLGPAIAFYGTITLPLVIPRACDFFDRLVSVFRTPDYVFSTPPQSRHPERSASQIYYIT